MHPRLRYFLNRLRLALRLRVVVLPAAWAAFNQGRALILSQPADVLTARQKLLLLDLHERTAPPFPAGPVLRDDVVTAHSTGEPAWAVTDELNVLWRQGWVGFCHTYPAGSLLSPPVTTLTPGRRLQHLLAEGYDVGGGVTYTHIQRA